MSLVVTAFLGTYGACCDGYWIWERHIDWLVYWLTCSLICCIVFVLWRNCCWNHSKARGLAEAKDGGRNYRERWLDPPQASWARGLCGTMPEEWRQLLLLSRRMAFIQPAIVLNLTLLCYSFTSPYSFPYNILQFEHPPRWDLGTN